MDSAVINDLRRLAAATAPTQTMLSTLEAEWAPHFPPVTFAAARIASRLCEQLGSLPTTAVQSLLSISEELMNSGCEQTQAAVATGFIEALASRTSSGALDARQISPMLGKRCRDHWLAWDRFCGVTTPGL